MARAQTYDEPVLKDAGLEWLADDAAWDDFPLRWRGVSRSGCVQEQFDDLSWHSAKDLASDAVGAGCSTIFQNISKESWGYLLLILCRTFGAAKRTIAR